MTCFLSLDRDCCKNYNEGACYRLLFKSNCLCVALSGYAPISGPVRLRSASLSASACPLALVRYWSNHERECIVFHFVEPHRHQRASPCNASASPLYKHLSTSVVEQQASTARTSVAQWQRSPNPFRFSAGFLA